MNTIPELSENLAVGAGYTTFFGMLVFLLVRFIWLRVSKDALTLKVDDAQMSTIEMLQSRIESLDSRVTYLEAQNHHLLAFITRTMAHMTRCNTQDPALSAERDGLMRDYERIISGHADMIVGNIKTRRKRDDREDTQ
jgi:hypothetical protein